MQEHCEFTTNKTLDCFKEKKIFNKMKTDDETKEKLKQQLFDS
jgi:hypothetical protein